MRAEETILSGQKHRTRVGPHRFGQDASGIAGAAHAVCNDGEGGRKRGDHGLASVSLS